MSTNLDVLLVKAREHKTLYVENIEDVRIGYIDALLQIKGLATKILDFSFIPYESNGVSDEELLVNIFAEFSPSIIIFFVDKHPTNGPAYTIELLDWLQTNTTINRTHITLYGNTQIDIPEFFRHNIDSVILGEEESAINLVMAVINKEPYKHLEGIAYQNDDNSVCWQKALLNYSLDELPFPTRYALNKESLNTYCASILSSRGCFGKCNYCYIRAKEKFFGEYPLRVRSIPNIVDEVEALYKMGVTEFYFCDDEFLLLGNQGIERVRAFTNEILRRNIIIKYSIYSRSNCINKEIVKLLVNSGLYCVFLGVESFSQTTLDRLNKNITVQTNINAINILLEYGVHIRLGMIMFDRYTTLEEFRITLNILKDVIESKPELVFQSMFFSNVLIPLSDTPAKEFCDDKKQLSGYENSIAREHYARRSRVGKECYVFENKEISDIYTCVAYMAEELTLKCINDENTFFIHPDTSIEYRLTHITMFSVNLIEVIYNLIINGSGIKICIDEVDRQIQKYYLPLAS